MMKKWYGQEHDGTVSIMKREREREREREEKEGDGERNG
jgi:hypothetical protein